MRRISQEMMGLGKKESKKKDFDATTMNVLLHA
jgi:hypothetical protein